MAGVDVALPLSALREVVPAPAEFTDLPVRAPGLLGAMVLRGVPLPVLDLRPVLGTPTQRLLDQVVVIVSDGERQLGLLADAVRGIGEIGLAARRAVRAAGTVLLFSHTVRDAGSDAVLSVLDVGAVLALPGVPTVEVGEAVDDAAVAERTAELRSSATRRTLTLLQCGPQVLALDVDVVHTTLAGAAARPSVLAGASCRGVTDFAGREVAVLDPLAVLGLGGLPAGPESGAGVVLDLGSGYVVLAVSAVLDIVRVPTDDVLPVPRFSVGRPDLLTGIVDVAGRGQCLVVDGDALRAEPDLVTYASVNTLLAGAADGGARDGAAAAVASRTAPAYLTYSVGVDVASRLDQVAEILPYPPAWTPTHVGEHVLGVLVHRRAAVPVLHLPAILGLPRTAPTASTCLLLVEVDGEQVAFVVDTLRGIDSLTWQEAGPDGAPAPRPPVRASAQALRSAALIGVGGGRELLPDLDLPALARRVQAETAPGSRAPRHAPGARV
ncbi:chemotaxis protein CheW [Kineosporiaceae bacterium B12]|nr:chemotaxis protein CheW [Kineococcus rubinsiae]